MAGIPNNMFTRPPQPQPVSPGALGMFPPSMNGGTPSQPLQGGIGRLLPGFNPQGFAPQAAPEAAPSGSVDALSLLSGELNKPPTEAEKKLEQKRLSLIEKLSTDGYSEHEAASRKGAAIGDVIFGALGALGGPGAGMAAPQLMQMVHSDVAAKRAEADKKYEQNVGLLKALNDAAKTGDKESMTRFALLLKAAGENNKQERAGNALSFKYANLASQEPVRQSTAAAQNQQALTGAGMLQPNIEKTQAGTKLTLNKATAAELHNKNILGLDAATTAQRNAAAAAAPINASAHQTLAEAAAKVAEGKPTADQTELLTQAEVIKRNAAAAAAQAEASKKNVKLRTKAKDKAEALGMTEEQVIDKYPEFSPLKQAKPSLTQEQRQALIERLNAGH